MTAFETMTQVELRFPISPQVQQGTLLPIFTDIYYPSFPLYSSAVHVYSFTLLFVIFAYPRKILPFQVAFYGLC